MDMKGSGRLSLLLLCLALLSSPTFAEDLLDAKRTIAVPESSTERFTFAVEKGGPYPHWNVVIQLTQGRASLRFLNPAGRKIQEFGAQVFTGSGAVNLAASPGVYTVEVTTTEAVGQWHLRVYGGPAPLRAPLGPSLASAIAMMLVAVAVVLSWRWRTGIEWRWFWVGAALWAAAVAVKFAIATPLNKPLLDGLRSSLPNWAYLTAGTIYGGLLTGVTEVLFTLIAVLIWRKLAYTAARGVAIGVGAGAIEAGLLALAAVSLAVMGKTETSWPIALAPAVERVIAILCHAASRALVMLSVARRRWMLFWYGFLLLSGVDALAMFLILMSGRFGFTPAGPSLGPWLTEAILAPFGLVSIPILIWCVRHWPALHPDPFPALTKK